MISTVSIIIRHAQGDERMALGVRTAFAAQSEGYESTLVFIGQGVYSLIGRQAPYLRDMIQAFQQSDGRVACQRGSLEHLGIAPAEFAFEGVDVLEDGDLAEILEDSDSVNVF